MNGARILVVDDSPFVHRLVGDILSPRGYRVEKAMNGHEAMVAIGQSPPDLLLLDIVMPEMSGYQVCRLLRADDRTRSLPVVMMTAKDTQKDRFWGLEVGADAYITKPIDEQALLSTVEGLLAQRRLPVAPLAREELTRESLQGRADDLLERKLLELTILFEVGKLFTFLDQPGALLQNALALTARVLEFDLGAVLVAYPNRGVKRLALRSRNVPLKLSKKDALGSALSRLAAAQGVDPKLLRLRETFLTEDEQLPAGAPRQEPGSEAYVILRSPQGALGVMTLHDHRPGRFSTDDRALLEVIASQLGVLLGNASLLAEREDRIETLNLEKRRVEAILRNLGEGVLVTDWAYRIIHANPLAHDLLGVDRASLLGTALFDHVPKSVFRVLEDQSIGEAHPVWDARFSTVGEGRSLTARFALVDEEGEETLGLIVLLRDATAEAEQDARKGKFLENISSQMRDPLTSLRGFLDILREEMVEPRPRARQALEVMAADAARLTETVDDLLSLARIELPGYHLRREWFAASEAVLQSLMANQDAGEARGVTLRTELAEGLPRVWADRDSVIDVVNRLIANAFKFAPPRTSVTVGVGRRPELAGEPVEVWVRDEGPGVSEDRRATIFDKDSPLRHFLGDPAGRGTLGLPICKHLVEMNGGSIRVDPAPGRGSVFAFTLPVTAEEPQEPSA